MRLENQKQALSGPWLIILKSYPLIHDSLWTYADLVQQTTWSSINVQPVMEWEDLLQLRSMSLFSVSSYLYNSLETARNV